MSDIKPRPVVAPNTESRPVVASNTDSRPSAAADQLRIGSHTFSSRLLVGTGKYASYDVMRRALDISGTECITVAVRRERLIDAEGKNLLDFIDTQRYTILPNTAGCFTADDAVRVARYELKLGPSWFVREHAGVRVVGINSMIVSGFGVAVTSS